MCEVVFPTLHVIAHWAMERIWKNLNVSFLLFLQIEHQLQCMLNESSVDYTAKFADLAAQIAAAQASDATKTKK